MASSFRRISQIRQFLLILPWIGFAFQCLLSQSGENVISAFLAASGSFLVFFDAVRSQRFYCYPLSTIVVIGFGITLQLGPLLFTALEGHPIIYNLSVPVATFGHSVLSSLICLLAHAIYRRSKWLLYVRKRAQGIFHQLQVFRPLSTNEVLIMGLLGLFSLGFRQWLPAIAGASIVLTKFIQGFQFFSIIPIAFFLKYLWSQEPVTSSISFRKSLLILLVFMALIVLVGLGRNSRSAFVVPLACLFLGLGLEWIYGLIKLRLASVLAIGLAFVLILPIVTDLATAMILVRDQRRNISAAELLTYTLDSFQNKDALAEKRFIDRSTGADWDETYISNIFLARFANAKYPDNSLENAARLSSAARDEMASYQGLMLLSTLPTPLLSLVGVSASEKLEINSYSVGDKLYHLASGSPYALGGFRVGHFSGTGMAGYGFAYLGLLLVAMVLIFPLVDSHALTTVHGSVLSPQISVVAITQLFAWLTISNTGSVVLLLAFILRGFIQPVLLFALVHWLLFRIRVS
ncbi:hypothetical protein [Synechococcus sp. BMK-MC-1]|uniref:hypothetical protein n=1 Tax=Synechococcus sp. BMK-MC-1 TaxID=1442551 RepID=UPI0016450EDD|nr:hypothetical protein [Synechococcus sp. BMK-MC-1]QNI66418.1 putative membrane protein [Synechococcus sp. BMK-MC-1]